MDNLTSQNMGIEVGDRVLLHDKKFTVEDQQSGAKVLEVREIMGRQTYVIETDDGKRKVVGASQVSKATE